MLNLKRPYGLVTGHPSIRYFQDGTYFNADGTLYDPAAVGTSTFTAVANGTQCSTSPPLTEEAPAFPPTATDLSGPITTGTDESIITGSENNRIRIESEQAKHRRSIITLKKGKNQ